MCGDEKKKVLAAISLRVMMFKCPQWVYFKDEYYGLDAQVSC